MKELLSGNEAVARGAWEAGVRVAAAYPGTPSTEIIENMSRYPEVYSEWAPNEKVALEVGIGASIGGARVLVAMKHVGVNVAADPLLTLAYTGVTGGLVLVSGDDPGMHSSQNEQDNRYYARLAKIPLLEPADSDEAREMARAAFTLSESFDTPVLLRLTTRVAHSQSLVETGPRQEVELPLYEKKMAKYVMLPAFGRQRHPVVEERHARLTAFSETSPFNRIEWRSRDLGVVCSGVAYQYVREVLPQASVLKLGLSFPFPANLVREFAAGVGRLYVVEELEPFLEDQVRVLGLNPVGKELVPSVGELSPEVLRRVLALAGVDQPGAQVAATSAAVDLPNRPPSLCPGCPHRGVFYVLRRLRLVVTGDIGCYTLGATPPLDSLDSCICMGASIGTALGLEKARGSEFARKLVAVIGDSTFVHSGLTALVDVVYNQGSTTVIILDNGTTAMTGHQDHPATGRTVGGAATKELDLEQVVRALGVTRVRLVDPYDLQEVEDVVRSEVSVAEPSVIIAKRPCVLLKGINTTGPIYQVDHDRCNGCRRCRRLGCPALVFEGKIPTIDRDQCTGCGLCVAVCNKEAIPRVD